VYPRAQLSALHCGWAEGHSHEFWQAVVCLIDMYGHDVRHWLMDPLPVEDAEAQHTLPGAQSPTLRQPSAEYVVLPLPL
jgi:hypothetical protein